MPRCKAPEILRNEVLMVRRNKPAPCLTRGGVREIPRSAGLMGVFQQSAKYFGMQLETFGSNCGESSPFSQ
jgi:hypothetical protein